MKMVHFRKDGYSMYTKFLRMINRMKVRMAGHCDGDGGGHVGHCY